MKTIIENRVKMHQWLSLIVEATQNELLHKTVNTRYQSFYNVFLRKNFKDSIQGIYSTTDLSDIQY